MTHIKKFLAVLAIAGLIGTAGCDTQPPKVVEVMPPACVQHIKNSQDLIELETKTIVIMSDGFQAYDEENAEELTRISEELNTIAPKIKAAKTAYDTTKVSCPSQ